MVSIVKFNTFHYRFYIRRPSMTWANKDQASSLKGHLDFHHYTLQTFIQLLKNVKSLKAPKDINLESYLNITK